MTREELNRRRMMFQINAKKNNLLKPEYEVQNPNVLRHSATNDYLEFRKKVAQGAKMQKEARVNLFNVTEANEQYRQELADKTILVHTGAGGMTNAYVAKLDDFYGPGKPRYFYTKEEWEGYQRNKQAASQAGAQRGAKQKEEASKIENKSYSTKKMEADLKNKSLAEKADEAYAKSKANEAKQQIKEGFNKLTGKNKPDLVGGREAAEKAGQKTMQDSAAKRSEVLNIKNDKDRWAKYDNDEGKKAAKEVAENDPRFKNIKTIDDAVNYPGGAKQLYDDYEKAIEENLNRKKQNADYAKNAGADKGEKESADAKKQADRKKLLEANQANKEASKKSSESSEKKEAPKSEEPKVSKEYQEEKEYNTTGKSSEKKESNTETAAERQKKILDEAFKEGANAKELASKYGVSPEYISELVYNSTGKTIPKDTSEYEKKFGMIGKTVGSSSNNDTDYTKQFGKIGETVNKSSGPVEFTLGSDGKTKKVKHSSEEDGITTDTMTPEQEYLNFRTKVEAGLKHFGQTRGLISIPINQALKNGESLSHAGYGANSVTNKYYAKIDDFWGKGKPRYFYSKEEWDGYQKNKQGAGQAEAARGAKDHTKVAGEIAARKEKEKNIQRQELLKANQSKHESAMNNYKDVKEAADAKNKALATSAADAYQKAYRNDLLNRAQSGREAAINNSSHLVNNSSSNSSSNNLVKKFANKLIDAINNKGTSDKVATTVIVENNAPEIVQKAQSGREAAEKEATKRTMTTMAYDKAMKDYQEVAKEIDKEYGFDKLDPRDAKAVNKTWQKLIKDAAKVIDSGKVDNPNNVKYEYQLKDDDANSYAWAAYIQEYASESLRLNSIYNDLQNEYNKTLQTAQAMKDFNAIKEANEHATELFDQMQKVQEQIKENAKENDAKVLPYLTAVYKELL